MVTFLSRDDKFRGGTFGKAEQDAYAWLTRGHPQAPLPAGADPKHRSLPQFFLQKRVSLSELLPCRTRCWHTASSVKPTTLQSCATRQRLPGRVRHTQLLRAGDTAELPLQLPGSPAGLLFPWFPVFRARSFSGCFCHSKSSW